MTKCIVCTPSVRPWLFQHVINHLRLCRGIENYVLINSVDNCNDEIRTQIESIDFCEVRNHFNRIRSTCEYTTYKALSLGFEISDYVIHIEEDILLSKDALEYFEALRDYSKYIDVSSIQAYSRTRSGADTSKKFHLTRTQGFQSWGWATWIDRFQQICQHRAFDKSWGGYDYGVQSFNVRNRMYTIMPLISRAKNIGAPTPEFNDTYLSVDIWADDLYLGTPNWVCEGSTYDPGIRDRLVGILSSTCARQVIDFYDNTRKKEDTI